LAGFQVTWVLRCTTRVETIDGARWLVRVTDRADTPTRALLAALDQPSDPPVTSVPCTAILTAGVYFALVDANGDAIQPMVPTNQCGAPRSSIIEALDTLPFRTIATASLRRL
jgi:hypothetical protein